MKHGNQFYLELRRDIFTEKYSHLSIGAKWLYVVLNEDEQRFTGKSSDYFYRSDDDLAADAGISLPTLKRYKAELRNTDLCEVWTSHFILPNGKKSEKKVTCYRLR